ncbi:MULTISPECIES: DUF6233 domain-containing protein [unclassified Streptomyces]|nr:MULTISPECIES: DUF6233 domain-containing protein [unclassified Streptomyces]
MLGRLETLHSRQQPTEVRRALAEGVPACPHCRPDAALGVLE